MVATLPASISRSEYQALRADPPRWLPVMSALADAHDLYGADLCAVADGSNLIARLGDDFVIKLFPPFLRHQYQSERATLQHLQGQLSVPTPALVADGEQDGWPYLIMTQLQGVPLERLWDIASEGEKRTILYDIGHLIAEMQAIPPGPLRVLEPAWEAFMTHQAEQCTLRQERFGLPQHLLAGVEAYLDKTREVLPRDFAPVILTGEYTPGNLLMGRRSGTWRISGLIDFGDVMVGFREYDLLGPSTFLASGNAGRVHALLSGFGYEAPDVNHGLSARLMRLLLLHRYSNLPVQVTIERWQDRARTLDELEHLLWPEREVRSV